MPSKPFVQILAALALVVSACSSNGLSMVDGGAGAAGSHGDALAGIIPGMAVAKFCHQLARDRQPRTLTLEIGDQTNFTTFTAVTGTCDPAMNLPCKTVPVGLLELRLKEQGVLLDSAQVILHDGEEYVIEPGIINATSGAVAIGGGAVLAGRCMVTGFERLDGGADGAAAMTPDAGYAATGR